MGQLMEWIYWIEKVYGRGKSLSVLVKKKVRSNIGVVG